MRPPGSRLRPRAVFFMLLAVALTALGVGLAMVDQVGEAIIGKRQREVAEAARDYFVAFAHEEGIAPLARALDLLPREFKLLEYLLRHKDRVVTRTMLLEQVWDYWFDPHTSVVDTHISRLRKKIDDGFAQPLLHTLRGTGYRLSLEP